MDKLIDTQRIARNRALFVNWLAAARWSMARANEPTRLIELLYRAELTQHAIALECGPIYVRMFEQLLNDIAYRLGYFAEDGQLWPEVLPILDSVDESRKRAESQPGT